MVISMKSKIINHPSRGIHRAVKMWINTPWWENKAHPRRGVATSSLSFETIAGLLPAPVIFLSSLTNQGVVSMTFRRAVAARSQKECIMGRKVFLGVDGGSKKHQFQAVDELAQPLWRSRLSNNHAGCEEVLEKVREWQEQGFEVWVGAEGIGGWLSPLDVRLSAAGCRWVNIHPTQFKRFCEAMSIQPDKTDEIDADLLANMLLWQVVHDQARVCDRGETYFAALQDIFRSFETLTKTKVACETQLAGLVREYWPELLRGDDAFDGTDSLTLLRLLGSYPTPEKVAHAGPAKLVRAMYPLSSSGAKRRERAAFLVKQARKLTFVVTVSPARVLLIQTLAKNLMKQIQTLRELETQLETQVQQHPFGRWMLTQEGIGIRTAAGFMAEAGDLNRFDSEAQLARYAGNGANRWQSGSIKEHHHDGRKYNSRLKRVTLLMAESRSQWHGPSKEYLRKRKQQGSSHWPTVKKLARHLIRFLWKGWQEVVNHPLTASG